MTLLTRLCLAILVAGCSPDALPVGATRRTLVVDPAALVPLAQPLDPPGIGVAGAVPASAVPSFTAIGVRWARRGLRWNNVEKVKGNYDFASDDTWVDGVRKAKLKILLVLCYGNQLHTGGDKVPPTTAAQRAAFAAYAKAAAAHFKGRVEDFEIWNEPDYVNFWPPKPDAHAFAALVKAAAPAIHGGNPNARVVVGGVHNLLSSALGFVGLYLKDGAAADVDVIGFHPYPGGQALLKQLPEARLGQYKQLRAVVDKHDPSLPAWNTEWGHASTWYDPAGNGRTAAAQHTQAVMVTRAMLVSWLLGLPRTFIYNWGDHGDTPAAALDREKNFGLLAFDGKPKPAYHALATLAARASGRQLAATGGGGAPPGSWLHLVKLAGSGDPVLVAWSEEMTTQAKLSVDGEVVEAVDLYGRSLTPGLAGGKPTFELRGADGPIYITLRADRPPGQRASRPRARGRCRDRRGSRAGRAARGRRPGRRGRRPGPGDRDSWLRAGRQPEAVLPGLRVAPAPPAPAASCSWTRVSVLDGTATHRAQRRGSGTGGRFPTRVDSCRPAQPCPGPAGPTRPAVIPGSSPAR